MNADAIKQFDDARKRLIETGTRNRLIHVNREISRGNVLNVVNERSNEVYKMLSAHEAMRFLATGTDRGKDSADGDDGGADIDLSSGASDAGDEARYTDKLLNTRLGPDALSKKLLKIALEAKTAEEESGINMLFLALGFLTWYEAKGTPREAPLVLLPVSLIRSQKTSKYDLRLRDEDIVTNLPLYQRLKEDFGVILPEMEIGESWLPSDYFQKVSERIEEREGWKVEADAIQLGFFSFSKLLMFRDLDANEWPDGALADHALTRGLLYEGFASHPPLFGRDDALDDLLPPEKLFHVVDADASQAKVIEEARTGRHMVIQGPPGTGKSQTITNMIAAAVKDGKRVLFLAEKMAALSVVHDRLVKTGLRDICLELHSRSANKRAVLDELARTLAQTAAIPDAPPAPTALKEHRDLLNGFSKALHRPVGETGETAYGVLGLQSLYLGLKVPPPRIESPRLTRMSREALAALSETIRHYDALVAQEGYGVKHPFEGTRRLTLQPTDLARLKQSLGEVTHHISALMKVLTDLSDALKVSFPADLRTAAAAADLLEGLKGLPAGGAELALSLPETFDKIRIDQALLAGTEWQAKRRAAAPLFFDVAFARAVNHLRAPLAAGLHSWLARLGGRYRDASSELAGMLRGALPATPAERLTLLDILLTIADLKALTERDKDYCIRIFGDAWRGEHSNFEIMQQVVAWRIRLAASPYPIPLAAAVTLARRAETIHPLLAALKEREAAARKAVEEIIRRLEFDLTAIGAADLETSDLTVLHQHFSVMERRAESYDAWVKRSHRRDELIKADLGDVEARLRSGECTREDAVRELRFARAEMIWNEALESDPDLRKLKDISRQDVVAAFKHLDRRRMKENVTDILAAHLKQVPQGALGEMGVIRGEIAKKRSHFALRKLFDKAGEAIQRIKPVLLMSPISVAQFLPPGKISFDLLIIDEASQVRPEDALGAIARAGQIVVVGDKKQLPPSSFFDRLMTENESDRDDEDDEQGGGSVEVTAKAGEMESILTLCEARGLSGRMLTWHYRSRDPSLITVSNREFYDGNLILPPSPLQKNPAFGLCLTQVQGVYDKGGKRDNRIEGEAVVERTAEHARKHPQLSLGIVTFSSAQRNLVTLLLEERRRQDPTLDEFLREGQAEDLFVKNIENVQGDERDVILVSVGYGPTVAGGRMTGLSFGPVNREGGERRLNVLFTRARIRCEIFASFDPGDIDPTRSNAEGPRIFKRFLDYAKYGVLDNAGPNAAEPDSPFEEDVAGVIRSFGFLADHQVGAAGFRIDLGVRHPDSPGNYLLAVECDGAAYHSALWARERDRLRQDVLEHLGWRFHRIWSTDWFYRRSDEIERLRLALSEARDLAGQEVMIAGANQKRERLPDAETPGPSFVQAPAPVFRQTPPYRRAAFRMESAQEPHEAPTPILADLVMNIVKIEGPVHTDEVANRITACYGRKKTGPRIAAVARQALKHAASMHPDLRTEDDFWFTGEQGDTPPIRNRSEEIGTSVAKPERISLAEIKAAAVLARSDNAGGEEAELIRTIARLLGFQRTGPELQARILAALHG